MTAHTDTLPGIDVVIPTRNRGGLIDQTLLSLRASDAPGLTIWVVDQSDDERTAAAVARHSREDPRVCYLRIAPRGISDARNVGVAAGVAEVVLFTDDDCQVEPGWAREMALALSGPGAHWAVFGRVLPDDEDMPAHEPVTPGIVLGVKRSEEPRVFEGDRYDLGFGHGASMGVRRDRLEEVGGFDPLLGTGAPLRSCEDRDLGYRIILAGGSILYHPGAVVHHRQWRTWTAVRRATSDYGLGAGAAAGKYLRLGDLGGLRLLGEWIFDQGLRQVISGVFKWRSRQKVTVGLLQIIRPWAGLWMGLRYRVDREHRIYMKQDGSAEPLGSKSGERHGGVTRRA